MKAKITIDVNIGKLNTIYESDDCKKGEELEQSYVQDFILGEIISKIKNYVEDEDKLEQDFFEESEIAPENYETFSNFGKINIKVKVERDKSKH